MIRKAGALDVAQSDGESHATLDQVLTSFADVASLRGLLGRALATRAAIEVAHDRPHDYEAVRNAVVAANSVLSSILDVG